MATSTFALSSATAASSRQIVVYAQEGVPSVIKGKDLVQTALYTNRGVACRLKLVGWSENRDSVTSAKPHQMSLISATTSSSGNSTLFPLSTEAGTTFHVVDPDDTSDGSHSILVASAYDSEDVSIRYDPTTFSQNTFIVPSSVVATVVLADAADFTSFGVPSGASWGIPAAESAIVLATDVSTNRKYLCVRENSELQRIVADAEALSGTPSSRRPIMGAVTLRLATVAPIAGIGWSAASPVSYVDINLFTNAPIAFLQTSTVAGVDEMDANAATWLGYGIGDISYANLLRLLYPVTGAAAGDVSTRLRAVATLFENNHPRTVKLLFNCEAVYSGSKPARSGGGVYSS